MKKTIVCTFACILFICIKGTFAQSVSVSKGTFILNEEINIAEKWEPKPVLEKLGSHRRVIDKFHDLYVYDSLGIIIYEPKYGPHNGSLSEIAFYFAITGKEHLPKNTFKGSILIEKLKLSIKTKAKQAQSKLKKYAQGNDKDAHRYFFAYKGIYVHLEYDKTENVLQRVSIGHDTPRRTI